MPAADPDAPHVLPGFTHLHVHSSFSFLDGGSGVDALARRASECGYRKLAITDRNGLYGAVRFHKACTAAGLQPIFGVELYLEPSEVDGGEPAPRPRRAAPASSLAHFEPGRVCHPHGDEDGYPIVLLAENRQGFRHLCRIVTEAQLAREKGHPRLELDMLARLNAGVVCLSGGRWGPVAACWRQGRRAAARRIAGLLLEIFGPERFCIEVQNLLLPESGALLSGLTGLARELGARPCATNSVHYAVKDDFPVHDLLTCCRTLTPIDRPHRLRKPNAENYLKSPRAMARLFRGREEALETAAALAERCADSMELGVYHFPDFPIPAGETYYSYLCKLCWEGALRRYRVIDREVMRRLDRELDVIESLGFAQYFLIMWDLVRWAREQGIRCAGRGSAADSIVTYVLGITEVDPIAHGLLFERFLNPQRRGAPDIDVDFDANRRDEVINYVYERYGRQHAAMVCTVNTLHARSAVRDLGKALDFPPEEIDLFAKSLPHTGADRIDAAFERLPELRDSDLPRRRLEILVRFCARVAGFPRHLGVHLGGMVVAKDRIDELVPLEWSSKGVVVTQWDKDDIEEVGLVKMDLLALKNLSALEDALAMLREEGAELPCIDTMPFDDPAVYALLRSTQTVGIFQVESPGMRGLLGRLQPEEFEDLIAQISLFRPGPLKADMITPFIARRHGREPVRYLHPRLEPIMRGTYGVLIYQEQVLQIAATLAGMDFGEADSLRRAMTHDRSPAEMEKIRETFLQGCARQGDVRPEAAERAWKALSAFAAYGFCKAHAAAFARTAYQTAWMKVYYPSHFLCGVLNNQPMGFYSGHTILQEAKRMGIPVHGVDINFSQPDFTVDPPASPPRTSRSDLQPPTPSVQPPIRVGLKQVRGISQADLDSILAARREGPFRSLEDFCRRTTVERDVVENLVLCGAFDGLERDRRLLLWRLPGALRARQAAADAAARLPLEAGEEAVAVSSREAIPRFPPPTLAERVRWEVEILGLCVHTHPTALFRELLTPFRLTPAARLPGLPDGTRVQVAGVVLCRMRPPTRSGAVVVFITLEDETGLTDAVIFNDVYQKYGRAVFGSDLLVVEGRLQRQEPRSISLIAEKVFNPLEGASARRVDARTGFARKEMIVPGSPPPEPSRVAQRANELSVPPVAPSLPRPDSAVHPGSRVAERAAGRFAPPPVQRDYVPDDDGFHEAFPDPLARIAPLADSTARTTRGLLPAPGAPGLSARVEFKE